MQGWTSQKGGMKSVVIDNLPQNVDADGLWEDLSYFLNNPNVYFENLVVEADDLMNKAAAAAAAAPDNKKGKGKNGKGGLKDSDDDSSEDESPATKAKKKKEEVLKRMVGKIDFDSQADALEFCHANDGKLFVNEEHFLRCAVV